MGEAAKVLDVQPLAERPKLEIVYRKTRELVPYARNARTHSDAQIAQIAASIREFGFTNPVLIDERDGIVAGHGRVLAAELLKLAEVPTITLRGLTENQRRAYIIADNKLALNAGWDLALLQLEIEALRSESYDVALTGWSDEELAKIAKELAPDFNPVDEDEVGKLDELAPKLVTCPECGHEWNINESKA